MEIEKNDAAQNYERERVVWSSKIARME